MKTERQSPPSFEEPPARTPAADAQTTVEYRTPWKAVAAICALQTASLGWFQRSGWFFVDDFLFLHQARNPAALVPFLRAPLFEHFSPLHRLTDFAFIHLFGLSWPAAAAVLLLLATACTVAFARIASALIARPVVVALTTALYALSLFVARNASWWTGGVHLFLLTFFSLLTFDGYVRWIRSRKLRYLNVSWLAYVFALLSHEQAMLLPPVLLLFRYLWMEEGGFHLRPWARTLWRELWVWLVYGALTLASLANFLANYYVSSERPPLADVGRYMWASFAEGFVPTIVLLKVPEAQLGTLAVTVVLGLFAVAALVAFSVWRDRRAGRAWFFFATAFVVAVLPLGVGRVVQFGVNIGREPRYQTAPAYLFALAAGLAFARSRPRRTRGTRRTSRPTGRQPAAVILCVGYLVMLLRALPHVAVASESAAPRAYLTTFQRELAAARQRDNEPTLFGRVVPEGVVPAWLAPMNHDSLVLPLVDPKVRIDGEGASAVLDEHGRLVPVDFVASKPFALPALRQSDATCPSRVTPGSPLQLDVTPALAGEDLVVRVRVHASARGRVLALVHTDDAKNAFETPYPVGPTTRVIHMWVPLPKVTTVRIQSEGASSFCVDEVTVGFLRPRR